MPLIHRQAAADGDEAAMEDAMVAEVDEVEEADAAITTEAGPQLCLEAAPMEGRWKIMSLCTVPYRFNHFESHVGGGSEPSTGL
jgi:hypothetical protein